MNGQASVVEMKDTTANPAPLGLLGFGMTTVLLNLHNAGFYELGTMVLAMGICYGGIAQVIAGLMEWKKKNTFGTTAFTSSGLFWLSLAALLILNKAGYVAETSNVAMGWYLCIWGIFTFVMFIGTLKLNRALQVVFLTLALLFWILAVARWANNDPLITKIAGFEGIVCGVSAIYTGLAQVLNECYGKVVWPLNPKKK